MAAKKKKATAKHKKETVKKHKAHTAVKKKELVEKSNEKQEALKPEITQPQGLVLDGKPDLPKETVVSSGSGVVLAAGVLGQDSKEQNPSEVQGSEVTGSQEQKTQAQISESSISTLSSTPEKELNSTPSLENNQDSLSPSGVIREKPGQESEPQTINTDEPKKKRLWIVIAIVLILLVLTGGALWYFRENVLKKASIQDEATPTTIQSTPTPATDSANLELDLSQYSIKVLNGSGIAGEAARVQGILEDEEFNVEEIGNADTADYEGTVIQAKKDVGEEFLDKLKEALEESFILDASEELEDSEEADVVIIVGSDKQL